tara:strand:- start:557 stop:2470 length:1914 start_codon:yes stop_codon:yes gene_type:complete
MVELPTTYQQFIHLSRYSRWNYETEQRETWEETVGRYFTFFTEHLAKKHDYHICLDDYSELKDAVLNLEIMPSMRCLMTAGPALEKENVAGYNCSYIPIDSVRSFDEILYTLMNGTGVGFSVEEKYTNQLPIVPQELHSTDTCIDVRDSKLGWAKAFRELISLLYAGLIPTWDLRKVRPAGSLLKTFGGRASGPDPLNKLFLFTHKIFENAKGRRLRPIECHDIVTQTAEVVIVGGVRRSALISLSDLGDEQMRQAKAGAWWEDYAHRALANNSANYHTKPDTGTFLKEWTSLYESKSGERGIYSSFNAKKQVERLGDRREVRDDFGTNPCSEIILRPREFCNLSEVVVRCSDDKKDLKRKVRLATILGTWQSTLTNFRYLPRKWKENCEEERLLGVSLTGIMDNKITNNPLSGTLPKLLESLKAEAIHTNKVWAEKLKITPSASITCVKPSGTVSQLCDSASGIHTRHSEYYIRTVRQDNKDPLCQFMINEGVPFEPDVLKPDTTTVFSFPTKAPPNSLTRDSMTAIEQLEIWKIYQDHWCEHKPSVTITVKEDEWLEVGAWVYDNFDNISGISFLPRSDHVYKQAPYQECGASEYLEMVGEMPQLNWNKLKNYEKEDYTVASQELACSGNSCELV